MPDQVWVLSVYHNAYDQEGPTIEAIFKNKPTVPVAVEALRVAGYSVGHNFLDRIDPSFEDLEDHLDSNDYQERHNHDSVSFFSFNLTPSE